MSRSGYHYDCDEHWQYALWRGRVANSIRGKRGQALLADLVSALEGMPTKRLIANHLCKDGEVCALGAVGLKRGVKMDDLDPEDSEAVAAAFDIADPLAREIVYRNDEMGERDTPEGRWLRIYEWAKKQIKTQAPPAPALSS